MGHKTSHRMVAEILHELGYSLQATRKTVGSSWRMNRDAQFHHIIDQIWEFQADGQPVISVETKKKELVADFPEGNSKDSGGELLAKDDPETARVQDFVVSALRRADYGVCDVTQSANWVNMWVDPDTAVCAAQSTRSWWKSMGSETYPEARRLLIATDCAGSNAGPWKLELQKLSNETGLEISICHLPPGTSKWTQIEHRLFCFISHNWRGKPLVSHQVTVSLIAATGTATRTRRPIRAERDPDLERDRFSSEWNYIILPASV